MAFLIGGANTLTAGYDIDNSCRFNNDDSASMSITPGSSGNPDKWTFSCWFKRGNLGIWGVIFAAGDGADNRTEISLEADPVDVLRIFQKDGGSTTLHLRTNRKFRDCSAWYHLCLAVDTGQGTDANKFKIYINGVLETSLATETYFSDDTNTLMSDSSYPMYVGRAAYGATGYWDGYLADCVFINDAQLAVSNFGETDSDSGIWKPIDVSGLTAGTNGFYLDFKDSANLGNDAFGGTDLTESNLAATDQTIDTPTNNFATLNPLQKTNGQVLSEGNLKSTADDSKWFGSYATIEVSSGKWFWETQSDSTNIFNGIQLTDGANIDYDAANPQSFTGAIGYIHSGDERIDGSDSAYGDSYTTEIIGVALNMDDEEITFYKDGSSQGTINLSSSSYGVVSAVPLISKYDGTIEVNFGNPPYSISSGNADANGYGNFEYAVPNGYYALCTKNLAEYG